MRSFVPISRIITPGEGWWEKRSRDFVANQRTVNPPTPLNDTVAVRVKLLGTLRYGTARL